MAADNDLEMPDQSACSGACDRGVLPEPGLYVGPVMHARLIPPFHRFQYRLFSFFLDLDRIDETFRSIPFLSRNRANIVSFYDRDHVAIADQSIREHVDAMMVEAGCPHPHRVMLLALPRVFGYVFNPISVFYCYDPDGRLSTMIYAVRNTFGEAHTYVGPVMAKDRHGSMIRQQRNKVFFVSPFLSMDKRYHFRVHAPGKTLRFRIIETDENGPVLSATQAGEWQPITSRTLARLLLELPMNTLKVVAGIYYEAAKIWMRGAHYHRRGAPPAAASYSDTDSVKP